MRRRLDMMLIGKGLVTTGIVARANSRRMSPLVFSKGRSGSGEVHCGHGLRGQRGGEGPGNEFVRREGGSRFHAGRRRDTVSHPGGHGGMQVATIARRGPGPGRPAAHWSNQGQHRCRKCHHDCPQTSSLRGPWPAAATSYGRFATIRPGCATRAALDSEQAAKLDRPCRGGAVHHQRSATRRQTTKSRADR